MLKVFIVEDESIVREGLRDSIPWAEFGFEFAGDAMDGETALPLILETEADVLITDIKMPFMDGLELSRRLREQRPDIKIIILSGYDDFEYAKAAIDLKVDQYLLKPIMKTEMIKALNLVRSHIEEEREQKDLLSRFMDETQEYQQYSRREFFGQMMKGELDRDKIFRQAADMEINLNAACFNIVMFIIQPFDMNMSYSESAAQIQDRAIESIVEKEEYILFQSSMMSYSVIVKGDAESIEKRTEACLNTLAGICLASKTPLSWHLSCGQPVSDITALPKSFSEASKRLTFRHINPEDHIFRDNVLSHNADDLRSTEVFNADPMLIRSFIRTGLYEETEGFVSEFLAKLGSAEHSLLLKNYLLVSARINAGLVIQDLNLDREELARCLPRLPLDVGTVQVEEDICSVLKKAIEFRDAAAQTRGSDTVNDAIEYINKHFVDENISLNSVAKAINISPNYLSAAFSQKTGISFIEYITRQRMEKAKELLRQTSKRSGEIGTEVGYKDPRYFSFVFKKTQGCTPKEYRNGEN